MSYWPRMTGSAWGTGPQQCMWFCHVCNWSGVLPAMTPHICKAPKDRSA